ncbi:MAG: hypothetical protein V3V00_10110 [Saprospiraceae bacterium]
MFSKDLIKKISLQVRKLEVNKNVDKALIKKGYFYLQAGIDHVNDYCGSGSYLQAIQTMIYPEKLEVSRNLDNILWKEFTELQQKHDAIPVSYFDELIQNKNISCGKKKHILFRFFPERYYELEDNYLPKMEKIREEEIDAFCTIWKDKHIDLTPYDKETIAIRKKIYNSVILDAFGTLGFEKRNTKGGLIVIHKKINEQIAFIIEPVGMARQGITSLDWHVYLGSTDKKIKDKWYWFIPGLGSKSFASGLYGGFKNARELEMCLRGKAEIYKTQIPEIEKVILEDENEHPP